MRTLNQIITLVNCQYGAPMGRPEVGTHKPTDKRIYDCKVPLDSGGYDKGGAYWGYPGNLRVAYTKDLSYIHFYRVK
jgi:hypothetical protein